MAPEFYKHIKTRQETKMNESKALKPFSSMESLPEVDTIKVIKDRITDNLKNMTDERAMSHLFGMAVDLEHKNQTLQIDLQKYNSKHRRITINLIEADLGNFFHFGECDQKLLALMYWDKLTPEQKDIFSDEFYKEAEEKYETDVKERMSDPNKMRAYFLKGAAPILNDMLAMAKGSSSKASDSYAFKEVWEVLRGIITAANAKAPVLDLKGKEVSEQIDEILTQVTAGDITFDDAKQYMSLVSSGFNLQELPKLMAKLDALESS